MKTIKIKRKNILKPKIKDFIFNSIMVKADIIWVKEKNKVFFKNKDEVLTIFTKKF